MAEIKISILEAKNQENLLLKAVDLEHNILMTNNALLIDRTEIMF